MKQRVQLRDDVPLTRSQYNVSMKKAGELDLGLKWILLCGKARYLAGGRDALEVLQQADVLGVDFERTDDEVVIVEE